MYMEDVACNDCHNVHSGKLILDGNALCLQCHKANDYDTPNHTFHKRYGESGEALISDAGVKFDVGSGTECINCHMHGQNFMGVDYRRDHSFRIPRPDLSEKNGTPNACNQCHKDNTNKWAADYITKWYGESRPYQYGEAFMAANSLHKNADNKLHLIIEDDLYSANIRSVAINYLSEGFNTDTLIDKSLSNLDPSIRIASINRYNIDTEKDLEKLLPLLYDETKAVRIETAAKLSYIDISLIPKSYKEAYKNALNEQLEALEYSADFPVGKYNLGNYYYQRKEYEKAEYYYVNSIKQDDELIMVKMNLAILYSSMNKPHKSERILKGIIEKSPNNYDALYNYGLILSENKKYKESLEYLIKAGQLMPENTRIDYNIAMLYDFFGDKEKAEEYLRAAINKDNSNSSSYYNLLDFYKKNNEQAKATALLEEIKGLNI